MANLYDYMLRMFRCLLMGSRKAMSFCRMDPLRSSSSPAYLRVLPRLRRAKMRDS